MSFDVINNSSATSPRTRGAGGLVARPNRYNNAAKLRGNFGPRYLRGTNAGTTTGALGDINRRHRRPRTEIRAPARRARPVPSTTTASPGPDRNSYHQIMVPKPPEVFLRFYRSNRTCSRAPPHRAPGPDRLRHRTTGRALCSAVRRRRAGLATDGPHARTALRGARGRAGAGRRGCMARRAARRARGLRASPARG